MDRTLGAIDSGSYRQRNVFLYPPQTEDGCLANDGVTGNGTCGTNGNTKLFEADQTGSSCDGSIEGPFAGVFDTKTTLVGDGDAVLYQVRYQGALFQNQITTLSGDGRRTRSAHQFAPFGPTPSVPDSCSFYRERRVDATEFYDALEATIGEYAVLDEDVCSRDMQGAPVEGVVGGMAACRAFLEESFNMDGTEDASAGAAVGDGATAEAAEQTDSSMPAPDLDNTPTGEASEMDTEEEEAEEEVENSGEEEEEEDKLQRLVLYSYQHFIVFIYYCMHSISFLINLIKIKRKQWQGVSYSQCVDRSTDSRRCYHIHWKDSLVRSCVWRQKDFDVQRGTVVKSMQIQSYVLIISASAHPHYVAFNNLR